MDLNDIKITLVKKPFQISSKLMLPNKWTYLATTIQMLHVTPIKNGNKINLVNVKFLNLFQTNYNNRKD